MLWEVLAGNSLHGLPQLRTHQRRRAHEALQEIVPHRRLVAVWNRAGPLWMPKLPCEFCLVSHLRPRYPHNIEAGDAASVCSDVADTALP